MHRFLIAATVLLSGAAAHAQATDTETDAAIVAAVTAAAVDGYDDPASAEVVNIRKSLARNGSGYCGEVSVEGAGGRFTTFHVVLETGGGKPSVLRLSDYPDGDPQSDTVRTLMRNFGCTE